MKTHAKTIVALSSAAILLSGLPGQTAPATQVMSGTATLADAFGTAEANPTDEDLTVSYLVTLASGVYTYSYTVNNPSGDVLLNGDGSPTTIPEVVDAFSVAFDTTVPGAYLASSQAGGGSGDQNNGVNGLFWSLAAVEPGSDSGPLSFESDLAPTWGNANASDANLPSPWASIPYGQEVPVPNIPESTATITLLAGVLLLLPSGSATRKKAGSSKWNWGKHRSAG
jgi:hypothetical protein